MLFAKNIAARFAARCGLTAIIRGNSLAIAVVIAVLIAVSTLMGGQARPAEAQTYTQVFLPLVAAPGSAGGGQTSVQLIDAAEARKEISAERALLYRVYAVFGDARLPEPYRGEGDELDTIVLQRAAQQFATLSPETQGLLAPFFQPPIYADSWYGAQAGGLAATGVREAVPTDEECAFVPGPTPIPSEGWECLDGTTANVRVWWEAGNPAQAARARRIYDAIQADIWPKLVILMRRDPPSDKGPHRFVDLNGEEQVWGDGGDGRLDIYLVQPPPRTGGAATIAYPPGCDLRPSFMLISPTIAEDTLLAAVTHEFFHTFQFGMDQKKNCAEYEWWSEATANWAIDFVYPQDNWEHQWAYYYMQTNNWREAIYDQISGGRTAYLLPLFLTKTLNDPGIIRRSWENAASFPNDSLAAIDKAVNGELTDLWHEFALAVANQGPVDWLKDWDGIDMMVAGDPIPNKEPVRETLGQFPRKGPIERVYMPARLDGKQDDKFSMPTEIAPLAMRYYRFKFEGTDTRSIAFTNPLFMGPQPDAKIQALIKIVGQEWRVEDWTADFVKTFCRDVGEQRVEELLIVISNGQWRNRGQRLTLTPEPPLAVTNIGCYRWEGTFETEVSIHNGTHNYTDSYSGRVVFEPDTDLPPNPIYQYYTLVDVSVEWSQEGTVNDCTVAGEATLANLELAAGNLQTASYSVDAEMDYRLHTGTVSYEDGGTATMTCTYGTFTSPKFHGVIAAFGQGTKPISADGLVLQGRHAETTAVSSMVTTWRLEAKPQP